MFVRAIAFGRCLGLVAILASLGACANSRLEKPFLPLAAPDGAKGNVTIFAASARLRGEDPISFTHGRSATLAFQSLEFAIPPNRLEGSADRGDGNAGPSRGFVPLRNDPLTAEDFGRVVASHAAKGDGEVTVFVHGFNTLHERAVLRLAQIVTDAGTLGAAIVFSWPSRGRFVDYLTDRESALYARDALEAVLMRIAAQREVRRINVLAHSMGAFLTMETIRQAKLRGDGEFRGKLNAVVLASPDIDLDVFRGQLATIGRRVRPTVILNSRDDRALQLARFLAGDVERVGVADATSPEARAEIERAGLLLIDLTRVRTPDGDNHDKFARAPAVIRHLGNIAAGEGARVAPGLETFDEDALPVVPANDSR